MSSPELHPGDRSRRQYGFGEFTLDLDLGILRRGVEEIPLRPKAFDVLAYLVEHHGRLVTKNALIEAVWQDTAVTDNSPVQCLLEIRRALGDDSQQLVRTIARRGYLFAAPVTAPVLSFPRPSLPASPPRARKSIHWTIAGGGVLLLLLAAAALALIWPNSPVRPELAYTQITNFTDSAIAPALSPDGRMVAFFRSDNWFLTTDQIWVKMLPNGEPVQITHDPRTKYGLAFSLDGLRIAYTVVGPGWRTLTVSPLGGEPSLLLSNAAGLTWLDDRRLLFSEIRTGSHMGVVSGNETRSEYRQLYFPHYERGMAHYSYASPDRKWALIVEMDPVWQPCRLIPLDGSSAGRQVGPRGKCTSAAWSPDGKWMYFGAEVEGNHHLWRQRFPSGEPEQFTSGPTEEDGLAVAPDGRSLITSIGMRQGAVWIHDHQGERPLSSEGSVPSVSSSGLFGTLPKFSADGKLLYYLRSESPGAAIELWRADLESGKSEAVVPGFSILEYDVSSDGKEVIFSTEPPGKPSQLWLAAVDRGSPARLIASSGESSPYFGPDGRILFRLTEGKTHYLGGMRKDGSGRARVVPYPIGNVESISPNRRWLVAIAPLPDNGLSATMAIPTVAGEPRRICVGGCPASWSPDGKFLYVALRGASRSSPGKTVAIPIPPGEILPPLPALGIRSLDEGAALPGARLVEGWDISPGVDPSIFAFVKTTVHRNLFRVPLPL